MLPKVTLILRGTRQKLLDRGDGRLTGAALRVNELPSVQAEFCGHIGLVQKPTDRLL